MKVTERERERMEADRRRIGESAIESIPGDIPDPIPWMEEHVVLPTSALGSRFNASITPWLVAPILYCLDMATRIVTLVKPIQTGGSTVGECVLLFWIMFWRGLLQYNWSTDDRTEDRWESRIKKIIKACGPVHERMAGLPRFEAKKCEIDFGNVLMRMQGVFNEDNLDSDSVPLQINEEVHSWESGRLDKARGRSTAIWNYKSVDISNAGFVKSQLHEAHQSGTMQEWEVRCPGCSNPHHEANSVYHVMRTYYDKKRPDLGGLFYDADGTRLPAGHYNYNLIRPTMKYVMPCGYQVRDDPSERVALSDSGRYSEPRNKGAELTHRSFTYEAVSVHFIPWIELIKQKHAAIRQLRAGDPVPWQKYRGERECLFIDMNEAPSSEVVVLTSGVMKNRMGLPAPRFRYFSLDRQEGSLAKNEFPHWWIVIRDFKLTDGKLESLLVFEGKVETDEEAAKVLFEDHACKPWQGVADSGDDTIHVYRFCMKYGINAIKGGKASMYSHGKAGPKIYSPETPLHKMLKNKPLYPYIQTAKGWMADPREPLFFLYSKHGIRERHWWLKENTVYRIPEDVSEDYEKHQSAENREFQIVGSSQERVAVYIQVKDRNDLYVCECYIAMIVDQSGLLRVS